MNAHSDGPGRGSTFTVRLPRPEAGASGQLSGPTTRQRRVADSASA